MPAPPKDLAAILMSPPPKDFAAILKALGSASGTIRVTDDTLDLMADAFRAEADHWLYRRQPRADGSTRRFEIVRLEKPAYVTEHNEAVRIESLTRHECPDHHEAEEWLRTFQGRAGMMAAIKKVLT